jgi:hypothetical protein
MGRGRGLEVRLGIPPEQRRNTVVQGAAFGYGGPKRGVLYVAHCMLMGSDLFVSGVYCYDSLGELAAGIIDSAQGHWALDLPFALPGAAYPALALHDWQALLDFMDSYETPQVAHFLRTAGLRSSEDRCRGPGAGCRLTDALSGAFGPLARHGPGSPGIAIEWLKMLGHLRRHDIRVYPFDRQFPDQPGPDTTKVYEVDPSHTRAWVGFEEGATPPDFVEAFNRLKDRAVKLVMLRDTPIPTRGLDAVVACATLANALRAYGLQRRWDAMPANVTAREWGARQKEGLIVRL